MTQGAALARAAARAAAEVGLGVCCAVSVALLVAAAPLAAGAVGAAALPRDAQAGMGLGAQLAAATAVQMAAIPPAAVLPTARLAVQADRWSSAAAPVSLRRAAACDLTMATQGRGSTAGCLVLPCRQHEGPQEDPLEQNAATKATGLRAARRCRSTGHLQDNGTRPVVVEPTAAMSNASRVSERTHVDHMPSRRATLRLGRKQMKRQCLHAQRPGPRAA